MTIPFQVLGVLAIAGSMLATQVGYAEESVAEQSAKDVVVKFRQPQEGGARAAAKQFAHVTSGTAGAVNAQVLNREEGVVRLRFGTAAVAQVALAGLQKSGAVERAAPNFLYRPMVRYKMRRAKGRANPAFNAMPFPTLTEFPEAQLPGAIETGKDPLAPQDWAMKNINLTSRRKRLADDSVITAVIDTGIDYNHEDLVTGLWRHPDNAQEVGYDFAHHVNKPYDVKHFDVEGCMKDPGCQYGFGTEKFLVNPGHGTHCAGHVGAVANNSLGIRGAGAGTAVMGLKFFYDVGEVNAGAGDDAAAIQSIDYAIKNGAKVISASWGGRMRKAEAERSELKAALIRAQKAGVLFIVASGNDGIDQDTDSQPVYPAAYDLDNLIVVGATDSNDKIADFSNYGAKSVHIGAPGVKILSTTVGGLYSDIVARFKDSNGDEQEMAWDGTSMATPIVAGAVAAVWTKHPNETYLQIRDRVLKSARVVEGLGDKFSTGGILDLRALLQD